MESSINIHNLDILFPPKFTLHFVLLNKLHIVVVNTAYNLESWQYLLQILLRIMICIKKGERPYLQSAISTK